MTPPAPPTFSVAHGFSLELGGVVTNFTDLTGLTMGHDVAELKETGSDGSLVVRRRPGQWESGEVVLTRPLTTDRAFDNLLTSAHASSSEIRGDATVFVHDASGAPVATYRLLNAWPRKLEITSLGSDDEASVVERLTLAYEQVQRT